MIEKKSNLAAEIKKYVLAAWMILIAVLWLGCLNVKADTPKGQVVLSIEKATLGQGFIIEPQYVDFYEGDNVATVTLRELRKNGRKYNYDGQMPYGFYLSEISDPNRGTPVVPEFIRNMMNKTGQKFYEKDNTPEYLGEKDYAPQSGWMYEVNGIQPNYSACMAELKNGMVIQWKFTLTALGKDVDGDMEYLSQNQLEQPDRVRLYQLIAEVRKRPELLQDASVSSAYGRCMKMAVDLRTSKRDVLADMNTLRKSLNWNTISDIHLWGNQASECTVKNGTTVSGITQFPRVLSALKGDGSQINLNVASWYCPDGYSPAKAGDYAFYPNIPDTYIVSENSDLPVFMVHVRKFGDVNGDNAVDDADVNTLVENLGKASDTEENIYDLNFDGMVNMQDYSLLIGAITGSAVQSEDDGRLVLRFHESEYKAGDEVQADLVLYSGQIDTIGIQFVYNTAQIQQGVSLTYKNDFQVEYNRVQDGNIFVMLGRRKGAVKAGNVQGICIGTLSFKMNVAGQPKIAIGTNDSSFLEQSEAALGYRNGNKVTFETASDYGKEPEFVCQLNDGRARTASVTDQSVSEDGITFKLVSVRFKASDAEDTGENRIRIRAQLPEGGSMEIGEAVINGQIQNPLTLKDDGIYYAEGKAGCFTGGQSPQKETCVLYGRYQGLSGIEYYKFLVERRGYQTAVWNYSAEEPLTLRTWSSADPTVLSGKWNLEDAEIKAWDTEGNPVKDLSVTMPASDSSKDFYYKADSSTAGILYAKKAGDYWLDIKDSSGKVWGKIRIRAAYPYSAADYFIKKANSISLNANDYNSSVASQLADYKEKITNAERIQTKYPDNMPVYLDGLGRYTTQPTSIPFFDENGCQVTTDVLRTDVINDLQDAIIQTMPVLEKNRIVVNKMQNPTFSGSTSIKKQVGSKAFYIGLKTNSNGKKSYSSSNKKVVTVDSAGKITVRGVGSAVITMKTAKTETYNAGSKNVTVTIYPKGTSLSSVKSGSKKTFAAKWKKVSGITGYQIQYSTYKNFKSAKTINVSYKKNAVTIKKLRSRKYYYVRIRTYKKAYGQTVYSGWSKAKRVKIK